MITKDISIKRLYKWANDFSERNYGDHEKVNLREKQKGFLGQFIRYVEQHRND